jgi:hypothetical protein
LSEPPTPANDLYREQTDDPLVADRRNFFKVELWTRDGQHIDGLLFAGKSLDKAQELFVAYARKRPRARLTIRQRSRVMAESLVVVCIMLLTGWKGWEMGTAII